MENDHRTIVMSEIMTPEKSNFSGNVHGGYLLQLMDKVAYACAARYASSNVVTLSVNNVIFRQPVHVGELVTCFASINYTGKSSMEVGIKVIAENLQTREERHTLSCFYTMVATNENLKPIRVKPLEIRNDTEQRRYNEGKIRREIAIQSDREHKAKKQK